MNVRRIGIGLLSVLLLAGAAAWLTSPQPAEASFTSETTQELVEYVKSDAARNLRLVALNAIREREESGIEDELEKLARGDDLVLAVYSTTQLGKRRTSAARATLRGLLEDTKLPTDLRKAAMTAIAVHFGTASDFSYLESESKGDGKLKAYCEWLEKKVRR